MSTNMLMRITFSGRVPISDVDADSKNRVWDIKAGTRSGAHEQSHWKSAADPLKSIVTEHMRL